MMTRRVARVRVRVRARASRVRRGGLVVRRLALRVRARREVRARSAVIWSDAREGAFDSTATNANEWDFFSVQRASEKKPRWRGALTDRRVPRRIARPRSRARRRRGRRLATHRSLRSSSRALPRTRAPSWFESAADLRDRTRRCLAASRLATTPRTRTRCGRSRRDRGSRAAPRWTGTASATRWGEPRGRRRSTVARRAATPSASSSDSSSSSNQRLSPRAGRRIAARAGASSRAPAARGAWVASRRRRRRRPRCRAESAREAATLTARRGARPRSAIRRRGFASAFNFSKSRLSKRPTARRSPEADRDVRMNVGER